MKAVVQWDCSQCKIYFVVYPNRLASYTSPESFPERRVGAPNRSATAKGRLWNWRTFLGLEFPLVHRDWDCLIEPLQRTRRYGLFWGLVLDAGLMISNPNCTRGAGSSIDWISANRNFAKVDGARWLAARKPCRCRCASSHISIKLTVLKHRFPSTAT